MNHCMEINAYHLCVGKLVRREGNSKVNWVIRDLIDSWWSSMQIGVTASTVEDSSNFPRVEVEKVYCGSFACTSASGSEPSKDLTNKEWPVEIVDRQVC